MQIVKYCTPFNDNGIINAIFAAYADGHRITAGFILLKFMKFHIYLFQKNIEMVDEYEKYVKTVKAL